MNPHSNNRLLQRISKKLPPRADILPVLAAIAVLFYGWSTVIFLWKFPGWLFFLHPGEVLEISAFQLTINLIESLIILLFLFLICVMLPAPMFRDVFIVRGTITAWVLIVSMMLFLNRYVSIGAEFNNDLLWWILGTLFISVVLPWLFTRIRFLNSVILTITDRLTVFLFILVPLSATAVVYVLVYFTLYWLGS